MKILVANYSFDASAKQITFTDYNPIVIERVLLITNVTDNIIIYNFANTALGGTAATNVLTLTYDTATMSDTDKLQIFYDDAATNQGISGTVTANLSATDNAVLDTIDAAIDSMSAKFASGTVIGDVNLGATDNAVLDSIAAKDFATQTTLALVKAKTDNIPALGQALAAASVPVVLTAAQLTTLTPPAQGLTDTQLRASAVPVSLASVPSHAVTNAGTFATQATLAAETTKVIGTVNQGTSPWVISGAVTNAVLSVVGGGTEATAQRVTIANDSTGVVSIDDNGASITVDGTVAVTNADLATLAGAVSATHMQVDVLTSPAIVLGAGTAEIGKLAAGTAIIGKVSIDQVTANANEVVVKSISAGDNNIGNVDVVSMPTVTVNSHAVTNAGTFAVQVDGAALTALQLIDNIVSGSGANISQINGATPPIGAGLEATAIRVTLPTDGTGVVKLGAGTAGIGKLTANSGVDIGDVDVLSLPVGHNIIDSGTITAVTSITNAVAVTNADLTTIAGAVSATHMQTDVLTLPANASVNCAQINGVAVLMGAGNTGTGSQRVTIATDQAAVASKAAINTYVDGSIVTIGAKADAKSTATDTTAITMMQVLKQISASVQLPPGGNIAHDAADSGNPIKVGGRASTTPVTAVAANDRVDAFFDVQGRQVITMKALTGTASNVNASATNVTILAANTARLGATVYNDSTVTLYLKLGATASTTSFTVKLIGDAYYEVPFGYYGIIEGIWASATGVARVTELT